MKKDLSNFVLTVFFVPLFFVLLGAESVFAGFGITPPYVKNTSLTRSSTYEQQILLVRSETNVAQKAEISIDAPEIEDWIQIVEGTEIKMPHGMQKVPMTVRVTVPDDAVFKDYTGAIRIRTLPDDGQVTPGAVSISLGARVDISLSVIDKKIKDFRVRKISAPDLNAGHKLLWLYFPGKINFDMLVENIGNISVAPSKVEFRIFDRSGNALLEETTNIGKITAIAPYETETVSASIPTRLEAGSYLVRYKIYNDADIKQEGDFSLNILPPGTLQAASFGFIGLSMAHKISVLLPVFFLVITTLYIWNVRKRPRRTVR